VSKCSFIHPADDFTQRVGMLQTDHMEETRSRSEMFYFHAGKSSECLLMEIAIASRNGKSGDMM
jgi:hypothetical protein